MTLTMREANLVDVIEGCEFHETFPPCQKLFAERSNVDLSGLV